MRGDDARSRPGSCRGSSSAPSARRRRRRRSRPSPLDERVADPGAHRRRRRARGSTSGTAFEQMQVVQDRARRGSWPSMPAATMRRGGASPTAPRPARRRGTRGRRRRRRPGRRRRRRLEHPGLEVALVLGLDRVGRVVREGAVELAVHDLEVERAGPSNTAGTTRPPMPLAVSATTFSGRSARDVDERARRGRRSRRAGRRSTRRRAGRRVGRRQHGLGDRP